ELRLGVEVELTLALALAPEVGMGVGVTAFTSVCMSSWIWVSSPSESNWASWVTNWLGSSGLSGLWFWSCTVSSCKNVLVKSTPGLLDEDEEVVADEEAAADVEAI